MKIEFISVDDNSNTWHKLGDITFGIGSDNRLLDEDGQPYTEDSPEAARIQEAINNKEWAKC